VTLRVLYIHCITYWLSLSLFQYYQNVNIFITAMFLERYNVSSVLIVQSLLPKTKLLLIQANFRHVYMLDNEVSAFIYEVHLGTFTQFG
jgi:hypothetical protein